MQRSWISSATASANRNIGIVLPLPLPPPLRTLLLRLPMQRRWNRFEQIK
jgi:hypothetical protein